MQESAIIPPDVDRDAFHCAHCGAYACQSAEFLTMSSSRMIGKIRQCQHCRELHLWLQVASDQFTHIYPPASLAPRPHADTPESIRRYYEEAAQVISLSPRAAAALLRLCIQHLIHEVLEESCGINEGIKRLVQRGLPAQLQQAFDIVRVTGNDAVHPGQIDTDSQDVALELFNLVNILIEKAIAEPKRIKELYDRLPEDKLRGIQIRDKRAGA